MRLFAKMMTKKYGDDKSFLDLLLNCLVGFVFLFMVAFIQIEPDKTDASIKTKAEYVITLTWPASDTSDVDIWIEDPAGNLISFKQKEAGLTHIDRDDIGHSGDKYTLPDGRVIEYEYNQEIATIRGFIPGEWTINLHYYNKRTGAKATPAAVRIDKLNPSVVTVFNETFTLTKHWQEVTVVRFEMTNKGEMIGINDIPVSLIKKHPDMKGRTG